MFTVFADLNANRIKQKRDGESFLNCSWKTTNK